jgi:hypothetical protein
MSEHINATALGAAGLGLPGLIWALEQLKIEIPTSVVVLILIISVICILLSLGLWAHILLRRFGTQIPLPNLSRRIALREAATRAYEKTRNKPVSVLAHALTRGSEEDILVWYCGQMTQYQNGKTPLMRLYGSSPPSREVDEIYTAPLNRHYFEIENGAIVLKDQTGTTSYRNLSVNRRDLAAAIAKLAERDV